MVAFVGEDGSVKVVGFGSVPFHKKVAMLPSERKLLLPLLTAIYVSPGARAISWATISAASRVG